MFHARTFVRSFTIQGSWNYRTLLGTGFAFCILPALQEIHRGDPEGLQRALRRHIELFNAHPYLAGMAMGATIRMETDEEPAESVLRFKTAVRGPLGGVGDSLIWAGWLPATMLLALAMGLVGLSPWLVVLAFLTIYNAGHIVLRVWAFRSGLAEGRNVGGRIRSAGLRHKAALVASTGALLVGIVSGFLLVRGPALAHPSWPWLGFAMGGFVAGLYVGAEARRPWSYAFLAILLLMFIVGAFL